MNALLMTLVAGAVLAAPTTVVPKNDNAAPGRKVYDAKCAACHGKTGTGSPAMAKMFKVSPDLMDLTGVTAGKLSVDDLKKVGYVVKAGPGATVQAVAFDPKTGTSRGASR